MRKKQRKTSSASSEGIERDPGTASLSSRNSESPEIGTNAHVNGPVVQNSPLNVCLGNHGEGEGWYRSGPSSAVFRKRGSFSSLYIRGEGCEKAALLF